MTKQAKTAEHYLSERTRERRLSLEYTQTDLAEKTGIHRTRLCNLEAGRNAGFGPRLLKALADSLHTSTDYLLGRKETP